MNYFPEVSLLITHYNRSTSLNSLLESFRLLNCVFGKIVISDDGSNNEHLGYVKVLKDKYLCDLICAENNSGLGNNINKGQDAIKTPYTLYIQEDFVPAEIFPKRLKEALEFMKKDEELDIVRFYAYFAYPYLKNIDDTFSEMYIMPFGKNYNKIYYYSDHPHLRRSSFFEKFGRYTEGLRGDSTEYKMCISFIQNKGKGLFYNDFQNLFKQANSQEEPSTMSRADWKQSRNPILSAIRYLYRQVKYNFDILMMKSFKD